MSRADNGVVPRRLQPVVFVVLSLEIRHKADVSVSNRRRGVQDGRLPNFFGCGGKI
jgi:hypothetical protein